MTTTPCLAVMNDAGSVGKTTTAVTIAAIAAGLGRRVLLADLDPQANTTQWLGIDPNHVTASAGDVLLRTATLDDTIQKTPIPGLEVLPSSHALRHHRLQLGAEIGAEQRLRQALTGSTHDLVIIDCQAGAGELLPVSAMIAATGVLAITFPSTKELEGIPRVEQTVSQVASAYQLDLTLAGIVPCKVPLNRNAGRIYSDAVVQLRESYGDLVTPSVRQSVTAVYAYDAREPLPTYAPDDPITHDYRAVFDHLVARGAIR